MAKRKSEETEVTPLEIDDVYSADELSPILQKMYAELGIEGDGQSTIYISQIGNDAKEYRVWTGTPDDYDLMGTARKFGSGDYRVKIYVPGSRGSPVMKANRVFPIKLEAGEDARLEALRSGKIDSMGIAAQAPSAADIAKIVAEAVKAAIPPAPSQQSNLGMLKEVAEIVRTLAPQPSQAPAFNPLDVLKIAAEFARERNDVDPIDRGVNATTGDIFLKLIDKFAPMFAQTLQMHQGQPVNNQPAVLPQSTTTQQSATFVDKQAEEATMRLKMGLAFLVAQAQADNDPAIYASVVLDNVPEESIAEFFKNPAPLDYLAQFEPKVKENVQWFNELIEAVKAELSAPDEEKPAQPGVDAEQKPA